ncbi:GMP/IMP nucleotidase [Neptunicella marina]|uniref:GMP/IMP nucleotidase n=1 Tax=Neptunicella marina TaxID=2125989 RepID=A0A8J6M1Q9_9ALTE|nr:GMP/IMP nucleotidase [Neptunicella marina]MBC3765728.1 GMP/IMP nucleotidase [Neptunicella marina]
MLSWNQIDTVLLDMDGTLLDLHFDNHFWMEVIPQKYAELNKLSLQQARAELDIEFAKVAGTLDWYCLDYWQQLLKLDIVSAKREILHLISLRDDTIPFLQALHESGREVVLLTNAHPDSLSLKVERTQLDQHINHMISTHEFGVSKESQSLWQQVQQRLNFDANRTLFVDDSLPILKAAQQFGIGHLLAVSNPDSQQPVREITDFTAIQDYRYLVQDILANPVNR